MTQEQLPSWVKVSSKCWYFSESQKTLHPVIVTSLDVTKKRIVVHFQANHSIWKTIPFDLAGRNGSLRPPDAGTQLEDRNGWTSKEKKKEEKDGTSTPPWYDHLVMRSAHEDRATAAKEEEKRKTEEVVAQQERRRYAWEEEKRRQQEEKQQAREMERITMQEDAEASRILIVQKLQREREEEMRRQQEVHCMELADEACRKINTVWRQRERVQRRQEEEERRAEEEEAQILAEEQYQKDIASRPRVSFGVKTKQEPARVHIPQQHSSSTSYGDDDINGSSDNRHLNDASGNDAPDMLDMEARPYLDDEPVSEEAELEQEQEPPTRSRWDDNGISQVQYELPEPPPGEWGERPLHTSAQPSARGVPSSMVAEPPHEEYCTAADWYHANVRAIYEVHNPSKLSEVPGLLEKYSDCQAEMYERICRKYGVQPETMPSFLQTAPRTRSRSRQRGEPGVPFTAPKASAASLSVGYAKKASAPPPPPPQLGKTGRVAPSRAPGIPAPSSSPSARDTSTSSLRARLDNLMNQGANRKKEENDDDEVTRGRDGFNSPAVEVTSRPRDSQRPPPPRDDIESRRGRSDSGLCHREERRKASSRPVLTPRPPPGMPPPLARNGSDWKRGRDDSRNRQQEHRQEEFHRGRSASRCSGDHGEWEERRDERGGSRGQSYDDHHHDRRRGDRVQLHPPDRSRSTSGNDTHERRVEPPPWREERRDTQPRQAADGRSTGQRGPYDGGHRNSRSYGSY